VISYCIAVYRPIYARMLVQDLILKTSACYEILIWLNVEHAGLEQFLRACRSQGRPVRIVGKSVENIGMLAYRQLFEAASYDLIVQIDDDVVCFSRGIAEMAAKLFDRFRRVRQIVSDVWQDEFTTGARPTAKHYRCFDAKEGLYDGPIDGWFSIYHRSVLATLLRLEYRPYFPIGGLMQRELKRQGLLGLLCTRMRVFHVIGPEYASLFGMLDLEIEKYRRLGRTDIVDWYVRASAALPAKSLLEQRFREIRRSVDHYPSAASALADTSRPQ